MRSTFLLTFVITATLFLAPKLSVGQEKATISAPTEGVGKSIQRGKLFAPRKKPTVRPVVRVKMNNPVYRYEGNPNINHDTASSPEIIFHLRNGKVVAGHDWDN